MKDYSITGQPTISKTIFSDVLEHRHSPALPEADLLFETCVLAGVDPNVAMAFFVKESSAGTAGRAVENKSWGNLRYAGWEHATNNDGFAKYDDWKTSLTDWAALLWGPVYFGRGLKTVSQVVPVYAPSNENDTQLYVQQVNSMCAEWEGLSMGVTPAPGPTPSAVTVVPTHVLNGYDAIVRFLRSALAQSIMAALLASFGNIPIPLPPPFNFIVPMVIGGATINAVAKFLRGKMGLDWIPV